MQPAPFHGPFPPGSVLQPIVNRLDELLERVRPLSQRRQLLDEDNDRERERSRELLLVVTREALKREEHYLRQLEHGSRILERVVELVAPAPVVFRGERLVYPESALEKQYNEAKADPLHAFTRGDVVELLEDLDVMVLRLSGFLAKSVPFATLRRWCADLAYPRAALVELLARIDLPEPPPVGHGG